MKLKKLTNQAFERFTMPHLICIYITQLHNVGHMQSNCLTLFLPPGEGPEMGAYYLLYLPRL